MKLSLARNELLSYTQRQLSTFFPDGHATTLGDHSPTVDTALDRLDRCFRHVSVRRYCENAQTFMNHLYSDHYLMYLWFLSNTLWKENADPVLLNKLYYLNKSLHGFDCVYDTSMPDIFLVFHGSGTVLGKADYSDYFVALQGCTVGAHSGKYPRLGRGVALAAHSSIIGECIIGNRVSIGSQTGVFKRNVEDDCSIYRKDDGRLEVSRRAKCYAQMFYSDDLAAPLVSPTD